VATGYMYMRNGSVKSCLADIFGNYVLLRCSLLWCAWFDVCVRVLCSDIGATDPHSKIAVRQGWQCLEGFSQQGMSTLLSDLVATVTRTSSVLDAAVPR